MADHMKTRLGVSVLDTLKLDAFKDVQVIGGHRGLERKIFHINVMEVPDILNWVREGELLFTTLYSIRDDPKEQIELIPKLAAKNLAGLAIKPKRFVDEIPSEAIAYADALEFPLLQLPEYTSFAEMIEPLLSEIFNMQTELLKKSEIAHNRMLNVVLNGGRIEEIIQVLQELIGGSAAVLDQQLQTKAVSTSSAEALACFLKNSSWPRQDSQKLLPVTRINAGELSGLITPLLAAGQTLGYLVAFGKKSPYLLLDEITMERAAAVVALDLMNQRALLAVEQRYRNEFVIELIEGSLPSRYVAQERAKTYGWQIPEYTIVMVVRIDDFRYQKQTGKVMHFLSTTMFPKRGIYGELGRDLLCLLPAGLFSPKEWIAVFEANLKELAAIVASRVVVGIGREAATVQDIPESYRQARRAANTAQQVPGLGAVLHYDQLGIYRLLDGMSKSDLQEFVNDTIEPLWAYDAANGTDFFDTLQNVIVSGSSIKQVAREMYVHYNTVVYRLEKIERILGVKLNNPEQRLSLEMAFKARDLLKQSLP